jgi:hypothetical protein
MIRKALVLAFPLIMSEILLASPVEDLILAPRQQLGSSISVAEVQKKFGRPSTVEVKEVKSHNPIPNIIVTMRYENLSISILVALENNASFLISCSATGTALKQFGLAPGIKVPEIERRYGRPRTMTDKSLIYGYSEWEDGDEHSMSHTIELETDESGLISATWGYFID